MIHRIKKYPFHILPLFQQHFLTKEMLLFDIETTGLSAAKDSIYCIGCGYRTDDEIITELFFAETPAQEKEILAAFFALLNTRTAIFTFNGTAFDIPFIEKRAGLYDELSARKFSEIQQIAGLTTPPDPKCAVTFASALPSVDLYREAVRMKSLLRLPSYRQKSIEQFLGCTREDRYDGGQLIGIYHQYVSDPDPEKLSFLLLHNEEDIKGMFDLIGILSWHQLRDGAFAIAESFEEKDGADSFYTVRIHPEMPFPRSIGSITLSSEPASARPVSSSAGYGCLRLGEDAGLIRFPIRHGSLKHFFPDTENYFYLPEEDYAVHKSIGAFVDPSHRRKATKQNCYTRQDCDYIEIPVKSADGFLRKKFRDNCCYLTLPAEKTDEKNFLIKYFSLYF